MAEPRTVTLSEPIKVHGEMASSLTLDGNPTLEDMKGVRVKFGEGGFDFDVGDLPRLIAPLAGIPPSSAKKICLRDLREIVPVIMDFFGLSLET